MLVMTKMDSVFITHSRKTRDTRNEGIDIIKSYNATIHSLLASKHNYVCLNINRRLQYPFLKFVYPEQRKCKFHSNQLAIKWSVPILYFSFNCLTTR